MSKGDEKMSKGDEKMSKAPCEQTQSTSIAVIPVSFQYVIEKHIGGRLFKGSKRFPDRVWQKSFVVATAEQKKCIDVLKNFSESAFMVVVDDAVYAMSSDFLVVEPLVPLKDFFKMKREEFNLGENSKSKWWKFIALYFTPIFGDIVHGLIYLWSLGYSCGDLEDLMYVDQKGRGKILTLLDKEIPLSQDIQNLSRIMQEIITMPFHDKGIDNSYELPLELTRFFIFLTPEKLKHIPAFWLYNYPFFWSTQEKIDFIKHLRGYFKQSVFSENIVASELHDLVFTLDIEGLQDWFAPIDIPVFIAIFERPLTAPDKSIKEYSRDQPIDAPRYMHACYSHINDNTYRDDREMNFTYGDVQIEECLSNFFPHIYWTLYEALYASAVYITRGSNESHNMVAAFRKWSLKYLRKEEDRKVNDSETVFRSIYGESSPPESSISQPRSKPKSQVPDISSLSSCLKALLNCAEKVGNRILYIPIEKEVMGYSHELEYGKDEIDRLITQDELEAIHISSYIRVLYGDVERNSLTSRFVFLCPTKISRILLINNDNLELNENLRMNMRIDYIADVLSRSKPISDGKIFLAPFNLGIHWVLCVIDLFRRTVFYLNSSTPRGFETAIDEDLKNVVEKAIRKSVKTKEIFWRFIQCPQQTNSIDCGYYVLRYMKEIVDHNIIWIPNKYIDDRGSTSSFNRDEINEVKVGLACFLIRHLSP